MKYAIALIQVFLKWVRKIFNEAEAYEVLVILAILTILGAVLLAIIGPPAPTFTLYTHQWQCTETQNDICFEYKRIEK